jgi:hypothetical protein
MKGKIRCAVQVHAVKKTSRGWTIIELTPQNVKQDETQGYNRAVALANFSLEIDNPTQELLEIGTNWYLDFTEAPDSAKTASSER